MAFSKDAPNDTLHSILHFDHALHVAIALYNYVLVGLVTDRLYSIASCRLSSLTNAVTHVKFMSYGQAHREGG